MSRNAIKHSSASSASTRSRPFQKEKKEKGEIERESLSLCLLLYRDLSRPHCHQKKASQVRNQRPLKALLAARGNGTLCFAVLFGISFIKHKHLRLSGNPCRVTSPARIYNPRASRRRPLRGEFPLKDSQDPQGVVVTSVGECVGLRGGET